MVWRPKVIIASSANSRSILTLLERRTKDDGSAHVTAAKAHDFSYGLNDVQ